MPLKFRWALWMFLPAMAAALPSATGDQTRRVRFGFNLVNTTDHSVEDSELWAYAPVKETSNQKCLDLDASLPFDRTEDAWGNQVLHFRVGEIPPYGRRSIRVNAVLRMSEEPGREGTSRSLRKGCLRPEPFVESDAPELRRLASDLRQRSARGTAEKIFEWVQGNLKPLPPDPDPRGALHALKDGRGDCTEAMDLVMALGRADGLPTRGVAGYVCSRNAVLDPAGFHNWAEYFDSGRWRLSDPFNGIFAAKSGDYIAFKIIGAGIGEDFNRFRFKGEGLRVRMDGGSES